MSGLSLEWQWSCPPSTVDVKPLVVILPWVWSEPQYVNKYTQLCHQVRPPSQHVHSGDPEAATIICVVGWGLPHHQHIPLAHRLLMDKHNDDVLCCAVVVCTVLQNGWDVVVARWPMLALWFPLWSRALAASLICALGTELRSRGNRPVVFWSFSGAAKVLMLLSV